MPIDADIQAADAAMLEKIKTQDWRNDAAARRKLDEERNKNMVTQSIMASDMMGVMARREVFSNLFGSIAPNYLKPSTATTAEGRLLDVERDVAYLDLVLTEALKVYDKHAPKVT